MIHYQAQTFEYTLEVKSTVLVHHRSQTMTFPIFIMVASCNRAGHYIFALWLLLCIFFFFSSPNLSHRRLDVCHISTHGVALLLGANLRCRPETCCTRLAENTGRKNSPKIDIWAPSHNFVGLYLRN